MALKKTLIVNVDGFSGELICPDAYWKVNQLQGDKNNIAFDVVVLSEQKQVRQQSYDFVPDMNGENFIAQAYKYLKSLPEFVGAQDC